MAAHPQPLTPKRLAALAAGLFVLLALSVWRYRQEPPDAAQNLIVLTGETMGTTYSVKIVWPEEQALNPAQLQETVHAVLDRVNAGMSTYIEDSALSRLNRAPAGEPFTLPLETFDRIAAAQRVSEQTAGAFDITVGPIVNAYGFGPDRAAAVPTPAELDALRERVGYRLLELDPDARTVTKRRDGLYCDLSAIAKGYGVDAVFEALRALGIGSLFVEIGGEVRAGGLKSGGEPWRAGIERPDAEDRTVERVIPLHDRALATSGDYRNYIEQDGRRISHTIDPRTGRPIEHNLASVSVLHDRCEMADAYATALMVLGPDEGPRLAEMLGLAALFIVRTPDGFETRETPAFAAYMAGPAPERNPEP